MGVFLHKNVKTDDDGISCIKITRRYGCLHLFFVLNIYPKVYLGEKINSHPLLSYCGGNLALFFKRAVLGGSCIKI